MVCKHVTILCYWNGKITHGSRGLGYEGGSPKPIRISNRVKYSELVDKMYDITGFSRLLFEVKITCMYPSNFNEYIDLPVKDDDTVSIVFDVTKQSGISCLEFYLEVIPINSDKQTYAPSNTRDGPFTQLLTQESALVDYDFDASGPLEMPQNDQCLLENLMSGSEQIGKENEITYQTSIDGSDDSSLNAVNAMIMEEIIAQERCRFVTEDTEINNNLRDDDQEDTREGIVEEEACDRIDQEEEMTYEEAVAPEFTNIDSVNNAVVDMLAPYQRSTQSSDDGELYAGQIFNTKDELQNAVKSYSVRVHQQYVVTNSSPNLWVLKCKQEPQCPWRLRASIPHGTLFFEIEKHSGPHTCVSPIINRDHVQLDSSFVANQIKALVKAQISITLSAIQAEISDKFNYDISKKKAWQAKQKAITELFGDWLESYKLLPRYMDVLQRENPGTIVHWDKEIFERNSYQEIFRRVFWAFSASIEGFKHCRPIISIDSTHFYGKYKGTMLIDVSCDANNQLFPLAFAIVEGENNDSWGWFMACIRHFVTQRNDLCVISDRHADSKCNEYCWLRMD